MRLRWSKPAVPRVERKLVLDGLLAFVALCCPASINAPAVNRHCAVCVIADRDRQRRKRAPFRSFNHAKCVTTAHRSA
jgi:hypothetical protein